MEEFEKYDKNSERELSSQIKEGLDFLDASIKVDTPSLEQFRQLVSRVEERKTMGKNLQFFLFLTAAIAFISLETYAFWKSFRIFTVIQIAAIIIFPLAIILHFRNRRKTEETL